MALQNPTRYVTVRRLARFRQKLQEEGLDASGKADKLPMTGAGAATEDNLMAIDENGNIKDSGKGLDDLATAEQAEALASAIGIDTNYEFVDLGLPSGTLWARCNVGAETETDYGNYYMYGKGATQYNSGDTSYHGTEDPLDEDYDTATQVMGAPWHMPTMDQMDELIANTTQTWQTNFNGSGINGIKFTSRKDNTKYIFFPAAGHWTGGTQYELNDAFSCWGSAPKDYDMAYSIGCGSSTHLVSVWYNYRSVGMSVRGVASRYDLLTDVKDELDKKADKSDTYTKTEVDNKLSTKSNINHNHDSSYPAKSDTYTKSQVDTKLAGKADTSHNHDDRYYQKSQVYAKGEVYKKSETYTKDETKQYVDGKIGLNYDATNRCINFPAATKAKYYPRKRSIAFDGVTI